MNTLREFVEYKLTHCDKTAEANGYPLKMENCKKNKKMRDLKVYGNSVQDGTPTPDVPVEVQCVGELTRNLFDEDKFLNMSGISSNSAEWYMPNSTLWGNNYSYSDDITFKENTQYTIGMVAKCTGGGGRFKVVYTDGTTSYVTAPTAEYTTIVYTSTANKTISYIGGHYNNSGTFYIQKKSMFVCEGATATSYEPYGKYKIPVVVRGKNMVKDARAIFKSFANNYTELEEDGRQCIRMTSDGGKTATLDFTFKENTQYTISFDYKCKYKGTGYDLPYDVPFGIYYTDGSSTSISLGAIDDTWRKRVVTSKANKTISHIKSISFHWIIWSYIDINTFQIEEGITATPYEPYQAVTTNIFLNEPLRKLGDYADYINSKENKVVRNVDKKLVNDETDDKWMWIVNYDTEDALSIYRDGYINYSNPPYQASHQIFSSYFPYNFYNTINVNRVWSYYSSCGFLISTDLIDGYDYSWSKNQKRDAFLQWAKSIGLDWYLARKTPIEEPLNIDLPKLTAKTTIIEVDTNLLPSNAYGKYIKK